MENFTHPDFAQGDRSVSLGAHVTGRNGDKTVSVLRPPETGR